MRTHDPRTQSLAGLSRHTLTAFTVSVPVVAWALELGVALTASHLLALVIIVLAASVWIVARTPPTIDLATLSLTGFVAVATVTVVQVQMEPDLIILGESLQTKAIKQLIGLWFAFGLVLGLRYLLESFQMGSHLLRAHFWTTVAVAVLALLQYLVAVGDLRSVLAVFPVHNSTLGETRMLETGVKLYGFPRVALTLVEPSRLGAYLLTGWAFWLYALDRRGEGFLQGRAFTLSGILLGAAIIVTGSRTAYFVFAVLFLGGLILRPHRLLRFGLVAASLFLASVLIGPGETAGITTSLMPEAPPGVADVLVGPGGIGAGGGPTVDPGDAATQAIPHLGVLEQVERSLTAMAISSGVSERHRIGSLVVTMSVLRDDPWLGSGYGTSEFAMASRMPEGIGPIVADAFRPTMLGVYNTILTETGIVGALCFVGLVLGTLSAVARAARSERPQARRVAWGVGAGLAAYAIAMVGLAVEVYQFLLVWMLLAGALALGSEAGHSRSRGSALRPLAKKQPVDLEHAPRLLVDEGGQYGPGRESPAAHHLQQLVARRAPVVQRRE